MVPHKQCLTSFTRSRNILLASKKNEVGNQYVITRTQDERRTVVPTILLILDLAQCLTHQKPPLKSVLFLNRPRHGRHPQTLFPSESPGPLRRPLSKCSLHVTSALLSLPSSPVRSVSTSHTSPSSRGRSYSPSSSLSTSLDLPSNKER